MTDKAKSWISIAVIVSVFLGVTTYTLYSLVSSQKSQQHQMEEDEFFNEFFAWREK